MSEYPSLDANSTAYGILESCSVFFQAGVKDMAAGTYDEDKTIGQMGELSPALRKLYTYSYRMGRYSRAMSWSGEKASSWEHEVGRAIAAGLDDAMTKRASSFSAYEASWSTDDRAALGELYDVAYEQGADLVSGIAGTGKWVAAGLAFAIGVAGTMYLMSRKSGNVESLEQERYANPEAWRTLKAGDVVELVEAHSEMEKDLLRSRETVLGVVDRIDKTHGYAVVNTNAFTSESGGTYHMHPESLRKVDVRRANPSPGMTVQSLLFNREAWDVGMAKRWAKNHNYRSDDVDVKPNTIRMRQADPKAFRKGTMRTIQFGEDSGIQAVVARPKR